MNERRRSLKLNYVIYVRVKAIVVIFVPFRIVPTFDLDIFVIAGNPLPGEDDQRWEKTERGEENRKLKICEDEDDFFVLFI